MKLNYHHTFRNDEGFLEYQIETFPYVQRFMFINQEYCDNGKWLFIKTCDGLECTISVQNDDEFEILEK